MSKPKYQLGIRTKKKMEKEVRASTHQPVSTIATKPSKVKTLLLKKKNPHLSKRTTPGVVERGSTPPHIIHVEGERWIKTLEKQTQAKRVIQTRKSLKNKGRA
jgi:hypothetical protein